MKNQQYDNDINPFTNQFSSGSGSAPSPINEGPPSDAFSNNWTWAIEVQELQPGERAVCKAMVGADDLATLDIGGKLNLELPPRGTHGGGPYEEKTGEADLEPGIHQVSLTYSNIAIPHREYNVAIMNYSITMEVTNDETGESSSYVPEETDPEPEDNDDEGDDDSCSSSSDGGDDSQSSSSCPCPEDDNGEGDNGEDDESDECEQNGGGSGSGSPSSLKASRSGIQIADAKSSMAGRNIITQTRPTEMLWRTNFGSFRGMAGMPQGFLEIVTKNFSSALWSPAALAYQHPMADRVKPTKLGDIRKDTAFQISKGGTNVNYYCYADGVSVTPIGGSAKRGGSAIMSTAQANKKVGASQMSGKTISIRSNKGNTVRFDAPLSSGYGAAASYTSKKGQTWKQEEFSQYLDVIRHTDDTIRQIWNLWDGLVNIENVTADGYRIAFYLPKHVGAKQFGLYTVTGDPFKTFDIIGDASTQKLTIREQTAGREPYVTRYWQGTGGAWCMSQGEGEDAVYTLKEKQSFGINQWKLITTIQRGENGTPISRVCETFISTQKGNLRISKIEGYGSNYARETTYTYDTNGKLAKEIAPDGSEQTWAYDIFGRETVHMTPWVEGGSKAVYTYYRYNDYADPDIAYQRAVLTKNATQLWRTDYTYTEANNIRRVEKITVALGAAEAQVEIKETWLGTAPEEHAKGRLKMKQGINGIQTVYRYEATNQHHSLYKVTAETQLNGVAIPGQSTRTVTYVSEQGNNMRYEKYVMLTNGTWALTDASDYEYDSENHWIKRTRGNGRVTERAMMCCGPLWEKDEDGVTITYSYNTARQLVEAIRSATETTPESIISYRRDALGRILSIRKDIGPMTSEESKTYDLLGQLTQETDILGRITTYSYNSDGLVRTVTTPAGATLITRRHPDGTVLEQSGTGQRHLLYQKQSTTEGISLKTLIPQTQGNPVLMQQTVTDENGNTVRISLANTSGGLIHDRRTFDAQGRLVQQGIDGMAPMLYFYDSFGNLIKETWKLTANPTPANSRVTEYSYACEQRADGIYRITTTTNYNTSGGAITQSTAQLISENALLQHKTMTTDPRGNISTTWAENHGNSRRIQKSVSPTSNITAQAIIVDGFTISQTDHAGIVTTQTRVYRATGIIQTQTDGRGNTITNHTDIAKRIISSTDAAGNTTTTTYCSCHDKPAKSTDALGNTAHYSYDLRGREIAEWGTGIQPACFSYDDADRLISLTTFRVDERDIVTDPTGRTDGDVTTWQYHDAAGLELIKTYADGTQTRRTYDTLNNPKTLTDARGIVTTYSYETARGLLLSESYSDVTTDKSYTYNILAQLTQATDASGIRTIDYNNYNESLSEKLTGDGKHHLVTELRDGLGRSTGYTYAKDGAIQQTVSTGYAADGRLASAGFLHSGAQKTFTYGYVEKSSLLHTLTMPNNMSLTRAYEEHRDLVTAMNYKRGATGVVERGYTYDQLGRPATRRTARKGTVTNDVFNYNTRSELTGAALGAVNYGYSYDNIGNRKTAQEVAEERTYRANRLNQYSTITRGEDVTFVPEYDRSGNQTLLKTSTGIWTVTYDANNRPVNFTSLNGQTSIDCGYDYMGRRFMKKVTVNGAVTLHQRYIYRGYLQIAAVDMKRAAHPCLWLTLWDPSEPIATRPLAIQKDGTWYCYGHDLTKNVWETFNTTGTLLTTYTYSPYGAVTASGSITQPLQWSSEYYDEELALVYYNYRHYNPIDGRWINRDPLEEAGGINLYVFVGNAPLYYIDYSGRFGFSIIGAVAGAVVGAIVGAARDGVRGAIAGGVGGAVGGAIAGTTANPALAGAAAGAVTSAITQYLSGEDPTSKKGLVKIATSSACGCFLGGVCSKIGGDKATELFGGILNSLGTAASSAAIELSIDVEQETEEGIERYNKRFDCFE